MENLLEQLEKETPEKSEGIKFDLPDEPEQDIFSQFSSSGGFDLDFEEEPEEPTKAQEKAEGKFYEAAARQYVTTFNVVVPKMAAMYSKANAENYKLTEEEKTEYEEVTTAFFESIEWSPDPKSMFYGFSGMLVLVIFLRAQEDKKRIEADRRRAEAMKRWKTAESEEERMEANAEMRASQPKASPKRRARFEIDADGFYMWTVHGKYIAKDDRIEKPTAEIASLIKRFEFDPTGERRSDGQINQMVRAELYGE